MYEDGESDLTAMTHHERYRLVPGYGEHFFSLDSRELEGDLELIANSGIQNLIVNGRREFKGNDLEFLSSIGEQIRWIVITPPAKKKFDYGGLEYCSNLGRLKVNNRGEGRVDVSSNSKLRTLDVNDSTVLSGFEASKNLRKAILNKAPPHLLRRQFFENKRHLEYLALSDTSVEDGLQFLQSSAIRDLRLYYCDNVDMTGVSRLDIDCLWIESCPSVCNLDDLYESSSLRKLAVIDSFVIEHASCLVGLVNLDSLIVLGKSYFKDGDLGPLKHKLRVFNFDNKRHYNISSDDFESQFLAK